MIETPSVDWLALSPTLALLGASGVALLAAVLVPDVDAARQSPRASRCSGSSLAAVFAGIVFAETPVAESLLSESMVRDRLAAFAQVILAVTGAAVVLVAWAERRHHAASTTRCSPPPAPGWSSSSAPRT